MSVMGPYGYSGGLNSEASLVTLPKNQVSSTRNMIFSQDQILPTAGYDVSYIPQPTTSSSLFYCGMLGCVLAGHNAYLFLLSDAAPDERHILA